ncbi:MAG: type II secretion system F family protein [Actinomycetota bacterium]|nr:type II secretion system F family protein [Actinomycetota bacterium]
MVGVVAVVAVVAAGAALRPAARRATVPAPARRAGGQRAARAAVAREWPATIDIVVLAIRAGHLPLAAIRSALPHLAPAVHDAFATVVARCDEGSRFADALACLPQRLGPIADPLADTLAAADRYGLPLAPVLDRLATEAHVQRRRRADTLARQLPVRLAAPLVACTLPSFVLLAIVPLLLAALSSLTR